MTSKTRHSHIDAEGKHRAMIHEPTSVARLAGDFPTEPSGTEQIEALPTVFRDLAVPEFIAGAGHRAAFKFLEYFSARIRNPNTRRAYYRNAQRFCRWMASHGLTLHDTQSIHVSTYLEHLGERNYSKPTIKQSLATIRELFDWLVVGQVLPINLAAAVRGPKHIVERGTTPILGADDATRLLGSIDTSNAVGCRDRAIIAMMIYTFARIHAVINMDLGDYFSQGKKWWVKLHEKNGKVIKMPVHHVLEQSLNHYVEMAGGSDSFPIESPAGKPQSAIARRPLFRTAVGRTGRLSNRRIAQSDAWRMIRRRARKAGITSPIGNHTFRATGITDFLLNGGRVEDAQRMAGHSSPRTTKLYDRRDEELSLDEIERIRIGCS